jgi:hypothetical protein
LILIDVKRNKVSRLILFASEPPEITRQALSFYLRMNALRLVFPSPKNHNPTVPAARTACFRPARRRGRQAVGELAFLGLELLDAFVEIGTHLLKLTIFMINLSIVP